MSETPGSPGKIGATTAWLAIAGKTGAGEVALIRIKGPRALDRHAVAGYPCWPDPEFRCRSLRAIHRTTALRFDAIWMSAKIRPRAGTGGLKGNSQR
jgi:hypothetical protein